MLFKAVTTSRELAEDKSIAEENRLKWYRVLARLSSTIDGLMGSADFNETERKLRELEEYVGLRDAPEESSSSLGQETGK